MLSQCMLNLIKKLMASFGSTRVATTALLKVVKQWFFASKGHDVFACIRGNLTVESRKEVIDKYWSNPVEAWFEKGKEDPSLLMLRFELTDAEVWDADPSLKGMFKMMTGKTVKPGEMGEHEKVEL